MTRSGITAATLGASCPDQLTDMLSADLKLDAELKEDRADEGGIRSWRLQPSACRVYPAAARSGTTERTDRADGVDRPYRA